MSTWFYIIPKDTGVINNNSRPNVHRRFIVDKPEAQNAVPKLVIIEWYNNNNKLSGDTWIQIALTAVKGDLLDSNLYDGMIPYFITNSSV